MKESVKLLGTSLILAPVAVIGLSTGLWSMGQAAGIEGAWLWINYLQLVAGLTTAMFSLSVGLVSLILLRVGIDALEEELDEGEWL